MSADTAARDAPGAPPGETPFSASLAESAILVVDDEPGMRNFLTRMLASRCKHVAAAEDAATAARLLESTPFDLILLDNIMPGRHGVDWLQDLRASGFFGEVILITAFADLDTAIQALRADAADFVLKPFRSNQILNAIARCLDRARLRRENFVLKRELHALPRSDVTGGHLVGQSAAMTAVRDMVARLAPLPTTVLLTGESGTGKEVTARALHLQSPRADKPFVPVNCAAIAPDIIESELFGHLKGAFTGAASSREGLFFYAQGGTLFLDEVAELPLAMQSKLLRVLEDKRVRPVGAEREMPVDVRLVAATNADLEQAVAGGRLRPDLYYRLNVMNIHLPPLRERPEDVAPLARQFMAQVSAQLGVAPMELDDAVLADLEAYGWPGNVRELKGAADRFALGLDATGRSLEAILGPRTAAPSPAGASLADRLAAYERHIIEAELVRHNDSVAAVVDALQVPRRTLSEKMARLGVRR